MRLPRELDPIEIRVLGCLLEKERTTPDGYPLTLNALTAACNQKSNREPVMQLSGPEVESVLVTSGHSRLPVLGAGVDDVLGYVHAKDLLRVGAAGHDEPVPLERLSAEFLQRALTVPIEPASFYHRPARELQRFASQRDDELAAGQVGRRGVGDDPHLGPGQGAEIGDLPHG